jgi:hypothetical protein
LDSRHQPVFAYHKSDPAGNMQLFAARPENGKWKHKALTRWNHPVPFSGGGSMGFVGIVITAFDEVGTDVFTVTYRHKDYGSGALSFAGRTLSVLERPLVTSNEPAAGLGDIESDFPGMEIRHADDAGTCGNPGVRYLLRWESLDANHDRPRQGPLPAPSTLRLYKITGSLAPSR